MAEKDPPFGYIDIFQTWPRPCLKSGNMPYSEGFFRQTRRFDAAILCVLQGKSTQYAGKRLAVRHVDIFQTWPGLFRMA